MSFRLAVAALLVLSLLALPTYTQACANPPTNDTVDIKAYLGRWYEIASTAAFRKAHEKNLVCTSATYSMRSDGLIKVNNTGIEGHPGGTPSTAIGKAKQLSGGKLAVSFFANFYGPYNIIFLAGNTTTSPAYSVAVIYSCTHEIIDLAEDAWILSRTPELPAEYPLDKLIDIAMSEGVDLKKLGLTTTLQAGCWN